MGIDKQENFRAGAIMIACGEAAGRFDLCTSTLGPSASLSKNCSPPLAYGGADVNLITGTETSPNVTQSETFTSVNPDNPNHIVVAYNDSRGRNANPINISGASVSTDGGTTFTRLTAASGQSPFPDTFGDPVVLYNKPTGTWLTVWLDAACGGQGLGGFKSTTPWDPSPASWTHFCVHNGGSDDRESGAVDNNPASPFANRLYISWNDFGQSQQIRSTFSSDGGTTWSAPVNVTTTFIRNVQITVDKVNGDVYIAGMDEMGGGLTNRATRSTAPPTAARLGPTPSPAPPSLDRAAALRVSSPRCTAIPLYWRHMGWGQPAAFNQIVQLRLCRRNTGNGDPGDVFYIRSTDRGLTFSAPLQLNTDTDHTKAQWMPNLSVSDAGTLFATWYDETPRVAASCQPSSPTTPCYRMFSRKSNDNGVIWLRRIRSRT